MSERAGAAERPCVLVFAGADPSGGAGIAADIQAIAALGAHPLPVITALTVQDNNRVHRVVPVDTELVLQQARALLATVPVSAIKIGIPGSADNAAAIALLIGEWRALHCATAAASTAATTTATTTTTTTTAAAGVAAARAGLPGPLYESLPVVLDPVLRSGAGDALGRDDAVAALAPLLPLATVITPNGPEAAALATRADAKAPAAACAAPAQAAALHALGCQHVLLTGGHDHDPEQVTNRWFGPGQKHQQWTWSRLAGEFHGSGCTLAAAIAALLARGVCMPQALAEAQAYTHQTLTTAYAIAPGQRIPQRMPQPAPQHMPQPTPQPAPQPAPQHMSPPAPPPAPPRIAPPIPPNQ